MCVCVCVSQPFVITCFFLRLTHSFSCSPPDPLDVRTSASTEWRGSPTGTNTHVTTVHYCPCLSACRHVERRFICSPLPVRLSSFVLRSCVCRRYSQQSRGGDRAFTVLQISPRTIRLKEFVKRAAIGAGEWVMARRKDTESWGEK